MVAVTSRRSAAIRFWRRPAARPIAVIIEFPDMSALEAWYNSAEYRPLMTMRQSAVDIDKETLITLEGV
jgi:uncharacterized protein (DUF1330 family)